jgi:hypothetical protein
MGVRKDAELKEQLSTLFILIQNQCSESLMQDIAGCEEYNDSILPARNGIEYILRLIREMAQNLRSHVYRPNTVYLQMRATRSR